MPGTFASMGPFECIIYLFSRALMWKLGASSAPNVKIALLDASRAHCQADATTEMAIELPPEEQEAGKDLVGELLKSLYGTRRAAHNWEKKWQTVFMELGFKIGVWMPAIVYHSSRDIAGFVHGDDFIMVSEGANLAWLEMRLEDKLILKRRALLGPDDGDDKTVTILNRLVTWVVLPGSRNQIEIEADPRHREILMAQMKLDGDNVKSAVTPSIKIQEWTPQMLKPLDKDRASIFRSATMRASCLAINRVDLQQSSKEIARFMAEPNEGAWSMLKRMVRYLVGHARLVQVISEQRFVKSPRADTDSDYAGCVLTRKSTTGVHLFHGVNLLKAGSWTQGTRALSVAESEFYAGVKGGSILLGAKSMAMDFGDSVKTSVLGTDSSAAKSIMERRGAGRIRHLHCPLLWLQERVDRGEIRTEKRRGEDNTSDICTKAVSSQTLSKHLKTVKMEWRSGRHPLALSAAV